MRRRLFAAALSVGLLVGLPASASAGTLDQSQTNFNASFEFSGDRLAAQTFTAGLSGVLDQVDLDIRADIPPTGTCDYGSGVTVQIRDVSGASPGNSVLATANIPAVSVPTSFAFTPFPIPVPPPVTAGGQYSIVVTAPDASCTSFFFPYSWGGASGNPYGAGAEFAKLTSASAWMQQGDIDADFKTYVGPPPSGPTSVGPTGSTGQRAAALASCKKRAKKHRWSHKRLRKCKKKANLLPV